MDPMSIMMAMKGGGNMVSSLLDAFGGSTMDRMVDPYTKRAVAQLEAAQRSNEAAYQGNIAAGGRMINSMNNDAMHQAAGAASANGFSSSDASLKALANVRAGSMLDSYLNNRNAAASNYISNYTNIANSIGAKANDVTYNEEPDMMTKMSGAIRGMMGGGSQGVMDGMKMGSAFMRPQNRTPYGMGG